MRTDYILRTLGLSAAALMLASSVQAQGKSHDKGKDDHGDRAVIVNEGDPRRQGDVVVRDGRDEHGNFKKVPPGLAKKPGQMPPGQYKKRYGTHEGADVLGSIMRRRGYSVTRIQPAGQSQYVYYRLRDGSERRAVVSPGTDRLVFTNVPASLLSEVLAKLY
jgi:hypothetical protein